MLPRRNHLFHDLKIQVFLRNFKYGMVVIDFIDAFCFCSSSTRPSIENLGNFVDCMKGRIRFMIAITSAYAHAYQVICLTRHMLAVARLNFRLPKPQARHPHLPSIRTTTRERGNDFQGWAIDTDGTRHVNGAIARSPHGRIDIMFGQVITTEAHLAFAGATTHSNNTAEMTPMIEHCLFSPWPRCPCCEVVYLS